MSPVPFQPHINGIRAVAIVGIVLYHLNSAYCSSGYMGVEAFLVISGFLLFPKLLKNDHFSYLAFWEKKVYRVLPLALLVAALTIVMALSYMFVTRSLPVAETLKALCKLQAGTFIDGQGDYFNPLHRENPLLHYWYLELIIQLWIIAPLVLVPVRRFISVRVAWRLLWIAGGLSLIFWVLTTTDILDGATRKELMDYLGYKTVYFHLIPRLWMLVAGSLVILLPESPKIRKILGTASLVLLLLTFWLYETGSANSYLAVASTVMLIRYGDSGLAGKILDLRPIQIIGSISFSLYLWHWPIFVFGKYMLMDSPTSMEQISMVVASFALAYTTWLFLEKNRWHKKTVYIRIIILLAIYGAFFELKQYAKYYSHHDRVVALHPETANCFHRFHPLIQPIQGAPYLEGFSSGGAYTETPLLLGEGVAPSFLLIGDSHHYHLIDAMDEHCRRLGICGVAWHNRVIPFEGYERIPDIDPSQWSVRCRDELFEYLRHHPEIRRVVFSMRWSYRYTCPSFGTDWVDGHPLSSDEMAVYSARGLAATCRALVATGREVIIIRDNPDFGFLLPLDRQIRRILLHLSLVPDAVPAEAHRKKHALEDEMFAESLRVPNVTLLDTADALKVGDDYPAFINGECMYADSNHLTNKGALLFSQELANELTRRAKSTLDSKEEQTHGEQ